MNVLTDTELRRLTAALGRAARSGDEQAERTARQNLTEAKIIRLMADGPALRPEQVLNIANLLSTERRG